MPAYYLDSSALLKRYIDETGSGWLRETLAEAGQQRYIAQIAGVEVVSAIVRLAAGKFITTRVRDAALTQFKQDFTNGYVVIAINLPLIRNAMTLAERHTLRSYDAVQLAGALSVMNRARNLNLEMAFVCADDRLNKAARAENLTVENPNDHR